MVHGLSNGAFEGRAEYHRGTYSPQAPQFLLYDYSRYTFSPGLEVGNRVFLSGHSASEYDPASKNIVVKYVGPSQENETLRVPIVAERM